MTVLKSAKDSFLKEALNFLQSSVPESMCRAGTSKLLGTFWETYCLFVLFARVKSRSLCRCFWTLFFLEEPGCPRWLGLISCASLWHLLCQGPTFILEVYDVGGLSEFSMFYGCLNLSGSELACTEGWLIYYSESQTRFSLLPDVPQDLAKQVEAGLLTPKVKLLAEVLMNYR